MSLPTLIVCEPQTEKSGQIEGLVGSQSDLTLINTVPRQSAMTEISQSAPSLVWLELSPDPNEGINLLETLKDNFPAVYFLVSNDVLDAALLKSAMQKGAFDFLDASSWNDQLGEVIARLMVKEKARLEAQEKANAASGAIERFTTTADRIPAYSGPINKMREREEPTVSTHLSIKPVGAMPPWLLPALALFLLVILLALEIKH